MGELFPSVDAGAIFSPCRRWRYSLWRIWNPAVPPLLFVGMNPSTADESENDNTVTLMQKRAYALGCGGLMVGNAFAIVETDSRKLPKMVAAGVDIIGADNDAHLIEMARVASMVICGWGTKGALLERGRAVYELLSAVKPLHALQVTKHGHPQHPLYIALATQPQPFVMA